jgi:hypothetical protein
MTDRGQIIGAALKLLLNDIIDVFKLQRFLQEEIIQATG